MLAYLQGLKFGVKLRVLHTVPQVANSRSLETRDVRCLVSPSRAFCSSYLDNSLLLVDF